MIFLKNISGAVKQLHTHEFQVDQVLEIDTTWYINSVITAISNLEVEVRDNNGSFGSVVQQLEYLKGNVQKVSIDQPKDSDGFPIAKFSPFADAVGFRFRGASFKVDITGNSTEDYDYLLTAERWINGGCLIINNRGADDKVTFQVVDKDNLFGFGAGVVLDEFINDFYIPEDGKLEITLVYPARLIQGLYLRMKYTSTHIDGCTVKCNLYLHMKT